MKKELEQLKCLECEGAQFKIYLRKLLPNAKACSSELECISCHERYLISGDNSLGKNVMNRTICLYQLFDSYSWTPFSGKKREVLLRDL